MIKFVFVVICFLLSIRSKEKLLIIAMFFTVIADYCMVLKGWNNLGLLFFWAVQLTYNERFGNPAKFILIAAVFAALAFNKLSAGYLVCVLCSVVGSFRNFKNYLAPIGMLLFLLCDINVALANIFDYPVFWRLIWVFYLPSQLLLAFSSVHKRNVQNV
ncbi:hypothetical protein AGMMS49975_18770 [Clostridia bacterium]|nr:hypothetical protein AGMMS49975_18770 [Clostridia bacterium]